ncbi:MAG: metal-dependent transcriptional regulator [Acutalibacteraceae bacterium]|nr:metal-dependent transcriptional regulator [Acutalibacteraceae bacterium]
MKLLESGQMYLESIYVLSKKQSKVRSIDVCDYLGFSKPSVSRAVGILKNAGYVIMDKEGYLTLTEEGYSIAEKIYERHTVITDFLMRLGVDKKIASEDACKIEHDISDTSLEAIKKFINISKKH